MTDITPWRQRCERFDDGHITTTSDVQMVMQEEINELRAEIEQRKADKNRPWLGLATTRELLDELRARIEVHALGGLDYRTVDGEEIADAV